MTRFRSSLLLLLLTTLSCARLPCRGIDFARREALLARYGRSGCIADDAGSKEVLRRYLQAYLPRAFPPDAYVINGRGTVDKVGIVLLRRDPCAMFGWASWGATYDAGLRAIFVDAHYVEDIASAPPSITFARLFRLVLLHELGHSRQPMTSQEQFDWAAAGSDPATPETIESGSLTDAQKLEVDADDFALRHYVLEANRPWTDVARDVRDVIEGQMLHLLVDFTSLSPVRTTPTHPNFVARAANLMATLETLPETGASPEREELRREASRLAEFARHVQSLRPVAFMTPPTSSSLGPSPSSISACGDDSFILTADGEHVFSIRRDELARFVEGLVPQPFMRLVHHANPPGSCDYSAAFCYGNDVYAFERCYVNRRSAFSITNEITSVSGLFVVEGSRRTSVPLPVDHLPVVAADGKTIFAAREEISDGHHELTIVSNDLATRKTRVLATFPWDPRNAVKDIVYGHESAFLVTSEPSSSPAATAIERALAARWSTAIVEVSYPTSTLHEIYRTPPADALHAGVVVDADPRARLIFATDPIARNCRVYDIENNAWSDVPLDEAAGSGAGHDSQWGLLTKPYLAPYHKREHRFAWSDDYLGNRSFHSMIDPRLGILITGLDLTSRVLLAFPLTQPRPDPAQR